LSKPKATAAREVRHVEVTGDAGQRIDNFLVRELRGVPKSRIYRMLRRGEVRINGRRAQPNDRLEAGDTVRIPPVRMGEQTPVAAGRGFLSVLSSCVLHGDDELIVLDKPSGIAVHGGSGVALGVIEGLRLLYPEGRRLELAHRIDRDTSGILLVARGRRMLVALHAAFREGRVEKHYDALVHGRWPKRLKKIETALTRYVTASGERRVRPDAAGGKSARSDFTVVAANERASWVRVEPRTGRTHQIRVHCREASHPIIGDEKYCSDAQMELSRRAGIRRLCLHASAIEVRLQDRTLRFEAPIPMEFARAWECLSE
jgi:23S rRNA pseudouridine955/2504/2580 synthase